MISQAQSTPVSENKKKDELDEESLDPNVRGHSFRVFVFESVNIIQARVLFFLLLTSVFMIFFIRSYDSPEITMDCICRQVICATLLVLVV